jgi:hypothetical protein
MNLCRAGEWVPSEVLAADLSVEQRQRLARVDALLRLVAARDRREAAARDGVDPRGVRRDDKW